MTTERYPVDQRARTDEYPPAPFAGDYFAEPRSDYLSLALIMLLCFGAGLALGMFLVA